MIVNDQINCLNTQLDDSYKHLNTILSRDIIQIFSKSQDKHFQTEYNKRKERHKKKFENQFNHTVHDEELHFPTEFCINLSSIPVPERVKAFLGLGEKFATQPTTQQYPMMDILNDIDSALQHIQPPETQTITRTLINNDITQHLRNPPIPSRTTKIITQMKKETQSFLRSTPDLVVLNSDKGNKTVLMDKETYKAKADQHLNDTTVYQKISRDGHKLTRMIEIRTNKLIDHMHKHNMIETPTARRLKSNGAHPPRIYMQIKTHKQNHPPRPVVSTPGSPTYNLTQFMQQILRTVPTNSTLNIKNSLELKEELDPLDIPADYIMASFDVVSLYTNIPQNEAIQAAMRRWPQITTSLDRQTFQDALTLCVSESNFFKYEDLFYRQIMGLPMGLSVSGTLAGWVLDDLTAETLLKANTRILYIKKYVDDYLIIIHKDDLHHLLNTFNTAHDSLKFTLEEETNNKLPFLDMNLTREGNRITTNWYCKEVASGRLLNYTSAHPPTMKLNIALSFARKVIQLSHPRHHSANFTKISDILIKNNFPRHIIQKVINKTKHTRPPTNNGTHTPNAEPPEIKYQKIPYAPVIGDKIAKHLTRASNVIRVAHAPIIKSKQLFTKLKAKVESKDIGAVYMVNCSTDNCNATYIGETGRDVKTRMTEHKRDYQKEIEEMNKYRDHLIQLKIPNTSNRITRSQQKITDEINAHIDETRINATYKTAAVDHAMKNQHLFNFNDPIILNREPHYRRRKGLESLQIIKHNTAINFKRDTQFVHPQTKQMIQTYNQLVTRTG